MKSHPTGVTPVHLQHNTTGILRAKLKQFKECFDKQQASFQSSHETQYYIVSTQYLNDWVEHCRADTAQRAQLRPLNCDIVDAGGQLRKGLVQSKDFEIVNKKIFNLIKSDRGFQIKRNAVFVTSEKRVPLYLDNIRYLKLDEKDLRNIDKKQSTSKILTLKTLPFPMQDTVSNLIQAIKNNERIDFRKCRLWKNNQSEVNMEKLFKYVQQKIKFCVSFYRFDGIGKLIDNEKVTLSDLNLDEKDYFIAEFADQYQSYFFKSPDQAKCQGCYKMRKLEYVCGCKKVAYCTQQCMEKDKRFHLKDCKFAQQQQMNQQIQMVITKNSALGKVGLTNLGNTCFMNSCLQCLSNTTLLTQYFINRYYEKEINLDNPLGSKGKLAKNYAKFIKAMWCSSQSTFSPYNLKAAVAKLNPIFSGYAQHDSQEFFSYLVDGIHEDLNRVLKKPYVQSVQSKGRPDNIVALQSWVAHTQRNQSIIVDLMTGQYKSKVVCPSCSLQSITFDPFTTISLPLPQEPTPGTLKFFTIFANNEKEAVRTSFSYIKQGPKQWLQMGTKLLKRSPNQFVFYVLTVFQNVYGFHSTSKTELLHKIQSQGKHVFLLQLTAEQQQIKDRLEIVTKFCKRSSHFQKQYDNLWFKRPFFFQKNTTTISHVYERMIRFLFKIYTIKKFTYQQYCTKMFAEKPFTLVLKYKKTIERLYSRVETNFDKEIILDDYKKRLIDVIDAIGVNDYQLDVRLTKDSVKYFQFEKLKAFQDIGNTQKSQYKQTSKKNTTISLDQCFSAFEQKQQLQIGNEWYCPACKQHRLATKQMSIYKAPQILILHLKRFKNKGKLYKQKNETDVLFPVDLDMKPYLNDSQPMSSYMGQLKKINKYIQPAYKCDYTNNSEPIYELFAISNHYGGLGGGHYTAFARNGDRWYEFNDSSVRLVSEDAIKGPGAYMLFYRRKNSFAIK